MASSLRSLIPPKIASASAIAGAPSARRMENVLDFYSKLPKGRASAPSTKSLNPIARYRARYFDGDNASGAPIVHAIIGIFLIGYTIGSGKYYKNLQADFETSKTRLPDPFEAPQKQPSLECHYRGQDEAHHFHPSGNRDAATQICDILQQSCYVIKTFFMSALPPFTTEIYRTTSLQLTFATNRWGTWQVMSYRQMWIDHDTKAIMLTVFDGREGEAAGSFAIILLSRSKCRRTSACDDATQYAKPTASPLYVGYPGHPTCVLCYMV